ncbi:MAG: hypothetical protein WC691_11865 [Sulfuricurvum sp.]|jgi:hypothetical protein
MYTTRGEYTEWHLTPHGWERGTEVTDSSRNYKDAPNDRVMTCKYSEHMKVDYGKINQMILKETR